MTVWDKLKVALLELREREPCALQGYPDPRVDRGRQPPFTIRLHPWAVNVAEDLHRRFGNDVSLIVGVLGYPDGEAPPEDWRHGVAVPGIDVGLPEPVAVPSGSTVRTTLHVTNHEDNDLVVDTNGQLVARVIDPRTEAVVGGFSGAMRLPLVRFAISSGATVDIPLLVGTASLVRALGYSLPPGDWLMDTILTLEDGRRVRTQTVPLTITS